MTKTKRKGQRVDMREMGKKTQPAKEYDVLVKVICDLCGAESPDPDGGDMDAVSWDRGIYDVSETALYLKSGSRYPEGTSLTFLECDICPDCFTNKLIPWLKSQGVELRERDVDY